jgi:methylmalonyl-CoA/ethylmalonyl-CoA epimerase
MSELRKILGDYIIGVAHVGFVVADMNTALDDAGRLYGVQRSEVELVPAGDEDAATRFAFFQVGDLRFEYIEPVSAEFKEQLLGMASGGGGINHVAWQVKNIEQALALLNSLDITAGHVTPDGIVEFGGKKMVYLDPNTTGGLVVELIEYPEGHTFA